MHGISMKLSRIALVGEMGSGKSTAADMLRSQYGYLVLSFAAPLKMIIADVLAKSSPTRKRESWLPYVRECKHNPLIREAHMFIGDELARTIHGENVWVWHFDHEWGQLLDSNLPPRVVVDDVRYPNEVEYLRKKGFYIVKIERDPTEREEFLRQEIMIQQPKMDKMDVERLLNEWQCHPSEAQIAVLDNDEKVMYTDFKRWVEANIGRV